MQSYRSWRRITVAASARYASFPPGMSMKRARFRDRRSSAHGQCDIDVCFDEIVAPSSSFVGAFRAAQGGE
jgi:hypothetical protein